MAVVDVGNVGVLVHPPGGVAWLVPPVVVEMGVVVVAVVVGVLVVVATAS